MAENENYALSWDDKISDDGPEFIVLPKGKYKFTVIEFERGRYEGSENLIASPMVTVSCEFKTDKGTMISKKKLFLQKKTQGFICDFFVCLGLMKPKQENYSMEWNKVVGSTGWAEVDVRKYKKDKNNPNEPEKEINEITKFCAPDEGNGSTKTGW